MCCLYVLCKQRQANKPWRATAEEIELLKTLRLPAWPLSPLEVAALGDGHGLKERERWAGGIQGSGTTQMGV
jgi:hypothetical protein